jgi:hypothetical protein
MRRIQSLIAMEMALSVVSSVVLGADEPAPARAGATAAPRLRLVSRTHAPGRARLRAYAAGARGQIPGDAARRDSERTRGYTDGAVAAVS